jgi:DNA-binding CsgD family transcriptional regulator
MDAVGRIIDQLYDGALDAAAWPTAFVSICELLGADHVLSMVRNDADSTYPFVGTARIDQVNVARFSEVAHLGMAMVRSFPEQSAFDSESVMPRAHLQRSDFFNDYVRPMGGYRALIAIPYRRENFDSFLTVCRGERDPDFDGAEIATLNRIVPHIKRALRIRLQLNAADAKVAAALGAFDQLDAGVAIVDHALRPVAINQQLEQILLRHDGLSLSGKALTASDRASAAALSDMVWRAASDDLRVASARTILLRRHAARPPWSVTARRLDLQHTSADAGLVVLLVEDLMRTPGQIEPLLNAVFGLTPREASLAAALARGKELADVAETLGITLGTARVYLKGIFAKTHTRRQAELVSLILRLTRFSG